MRYFYQAVGECVSQVYEIKEANSLDEAKEIAFGTWKSTTFFANVKMMQTLAKKTVCVKMI